MVRAEEEANTPVAGQPGEGVLVVALCEAELRADSLVIDAKFHSSMVEYARRLGRPLACLLPRLLEADWTESIGAAVIPLAGLPYQVHLVSSRDLDQADRALLASLLDRVGLAYVGEGNELNLAAAGACQARGIPYVVTTERTLRTSIEIMRASVASPLRRLVKAARLHLQNRPRLRHLAQAAEVHCNGYPTYQELAPVNPRRLLFFDTRAAAADVPSEAEVLARLASLPGRPHRLIFSGRYHPIKGALDVIRTALELVRIGVDFRLDTFGAGSEREAMVALVRRHGQEGRITVHGRVPYQPDLVDWTRRADLFVACHLQGDPSCTYLETFACGVPIAGYRNEMWAELQLASGGGVGTPIGDPRQLAEAIAALLADRERLRAASLAARAFGASHTVETAWAERTARLGAILAGAGRGPALAGPGHGDMTRALP